MRDEAEVKHEEYTLAESAYNVYRMSQNHVDAIGFHIPEFEDSPQGPTPWLAVAAKAYETLEDVSGLPFFEFARQLYDAWASCLDVPFGFESLDPRTQFAWQAVARHLANVIGNEHENPASVEEIWNGWAANKSEQAIA